LQANGGQWWMSKESSAPPGIRVDLGRKPVLGLLFCQFGLDTGRYTAGDMPYYGGLVS